MFQMKHVIILNIFQEDAIFYSINLKFNHPMSTGLCHLVFLNGILLASVFNLNHGFILFFIVLLIQLVFFYYLVVE